MPLEHQWRPEEPAVNRVPEDTLEDAEIEGARFQRPMLPDRLHGDEHRKRRDRCEQPATSRHKGKQTVNDGRPWTDG